jgi:hypothetical protein
VSLLGDAALFVIGFVAAVINVLPGAGRSCRSGGRAAALEPGAW